MYANKRRNKEFTLKKKDIVYLFRRNIKIKRLSNKLNHIKLELFKILKTKKLINYKSNLLVTIRKYSIFYIFLLKSADLNTLI